MSSHPLASVAKRRDRVGRVITQTASATRPLDAAQVAEAVLPHLPPGIDLAALYRSLLPLHGQPADPKTVREAAWAVAANLPELKAGRPVYPPVLPATPAAVTLIVLAVSRVSRPFRPGQPPQDPRSRFRLQIAKGPGCPKVIEVVWSDKYVRYLASHPNGFGFARPPRGNRRPTGRPYHHPDTLTGMVFRAKVAVGQDGKPVLTNATCTPSQLEFNRALTEMRWRAGFVCPFGFAHHCHDCPKGQASCPAACRPLDLIQLSCPVCTKTAHADPAWPNAGVCTRCAAQGRRPPTPKEPPKCPSPR